MIMGNRRGPIIITILRVSRQFCAAAMWSLKAVPDGHMFTIPEDTEPIKVGRHEDCQLHIANDQSVSRVHCHLRVKTIDGRTELTVADCRSKFGSFVNGQQLKPEVEHLLRVGDRIKFGAVNSEYIVEQQVGLQQPSVMPLSKRQVAELLVNGKPVPNNSLYKPRHIDRTLLFNGLSIKPGTECDELIKQCGGTVTSDGEPWMEEEILDAIIFGRLRSKPKTSVTVIAEFNLPPQPTKMITTVNTTINHSNSPLLNVKRFRKVQPLSLPDIIGLSDMTVHHKPAAIQSTTQQRIKIDENTLQPQAPVHPEYQPKRPIEQYFDAPQPQKRIKAQPTPEPVSTPQDFQTDFFKSLL